MVEPTNPNPQSDPLQFFGVPSASPGLSVLRELTDGEDKFTLSHQPMASPPIPPAPEPIKRQKRNHNIQTLADLRKYAALIKKTDSSPVAFYTEEAVNLVLDETGETECEMIHCSLNRHSDFKAWDAVCGKQMTVPAFVDFLRSNSESIKLALDSDEDYDNMLGVFSALTGTLVSDIDDQELFKGQAVSFIVRRKKRGTETDTEVDGIPTSFDIKLAVLLDDEELVDFTVRVKFAPGQGGSILITMVIDSMTAIVSRHIDMRLKEFASDAGFMCVRGCPNYQSWTEPTLPAAVAQLMELQTSMIAAMTGNQD